MKNNRVTGQEIGCNPAKTGELASMLVKLKIVVLNVNVFLCPFAH
jgi:hypothetical protein